MPYKHIKYKIPTKLKRSAKLSPEDKRYIIELYKSGEFSKRGLAREFGVSPRTIDFTLNPEKRIQNYQLRVARGGSKQYYDKDKHTKTIREHRKYKQSLYLNNKLEKDEM
jgi:transposase-like protein